ncbi:MAG: SIS domain-containing protein [Kiritimatiellae bacterium]|nr:SIS domain-containing protein [Kiritimatiellia bacterium]
MSDFAKKHLDETIAIVQQIDTKILETFVDKLVELRDRNGRLFFIGVGGSAANCSHAANDFRKLAGIEAYAPTDNVAELTARINDEGWAGAFAAWLQASRLDKKDMIFIMSVGGGDAQRNVSPNIVEAIKYAKNVGTQVVGIVGRDGGYTAQQSDVCVVIPTVNPEMVTPHTESFQAVLWHLIISHPKLKSAPTKWESIT